MDGIQPRSGNWRLRLPVTDLSMALSPNFGERPDGAIPDLVVIHYTAMDDCDAARRWLCNPDAEVSAHYLISEAGGVSVLVPEESRAWHAGAGSWGKVQDVNSRSIGIELSNTGFAPFAAAQMDALEQLLRGIMTRWAIRPERVIGHSDCSVGRKIDPGPRFDWARLARSGLAISASASQPAHAPDMTAFLRDLGRIGYDPAADVQALLNAFRLRHRQGHSGPLDGTDCAIAQDLALRFPVDRAAPVA